MEKAFEAKSVEECLEAACKEFQAKKEELDFSVVQEPSKGFLGIGSKNAIVKVSLNDTFNVRQIKEFLEKLIGFYNQKVEINVDIVKEMLSYSVRIKSDSPLSNLIGKHGHTMEAIEHILSVYINKINDHRISVKVDINDYRTRRENFVKQIVTESIKKIESGRAKRISLEPMNIHERKIAHEILSQYPNLKAYSVGNEPYRHIIIESSKVKISK